MVFNCLQSCEPETGHSFGDRHGYGSKYTTTRLRVVVASGAATAAPALSIINCQLSIVPHFLHFLFKRFLKLLVVVIDL